MSIFIKLSLVKRNVHTVSYVQMNKVHASGRPFREVRSEYIGIVKKVLAGMAPLNGSAPKVFRIIEAAVSAKRGSDLELTEEETELLVETVTKLRSILGELNDAYRCRDAHEWVDLSLRNLASEYELATA
jgi:hypothetical protein